MAQSSSDAVIISSGSTNTPGYRIVVNKDGDAQYTVTLRRSGTATQSEPVRKTLPEVLARQLFSDLAAAKPLANLPAPHCAKSASFGTRLTIEFGGDQTPDLSCSGARDEHIQALRRDADDIAKKFRASD